MTAPSDPTPRWEPPDPQHRFRHRPDRVAYIAAVLSTLAALVLAVAVPVGGVLVARSWPGGTTAESSRTTSGTGVGDPYFPDYGSPGYDARAYVIKGTWQPDGTWTATTTITAVATEDLVTVAVDLALDVTAASIDGRSAAVSRSGFQDVTLTTGTEIARGNTFTVVISSTGKPASIQRGSIAPASITRSEWLVAGEPESSAWWFPANDHPSDPALIDLSVTVPAGMEAVSIGRLESRDTDDDADTATWHWVSDAPVATYLIFLGIGHFSLETGTADGRPYVYAVSELLSRTEQDKAFAALRTTPDVIEAEERLYGPYPFDAIGGFVPAADLWFDGLETQTRPVYAASAITSGYATDLLVHELAHMWFGDHVTVADWDDIFTNEAYASWTQWEYAADHGGPPADDRLRSAYDRYRDRPGLWRITMIDPGADHLFDAVYIRGPMTLQALRNVIGDDAFATLNREWAQDPGSRSLEQWMVKAQSVTRTDLTPFFDAWIYGTTAPPDTTAYGLG